MAVEFELLGSVEARIDDRGVDLGHARQRCVLAALLVDANRAVPVDRLIDRVWADRPPQRARNILSGYLSRLRQALAVDEVHLRRQPAGYLLTVDPLAVDLHRFHHLLTQARAAVEDEAALALVEQALGLWRGEALATLDTPWINSVRAALDAERLAAELDRNDLGLRLGRHTGLLAGLVSAAATHPLDERLAGQLMVALYGSGRQADALAHYEQIRRRLVDELGADPSPPLQRLHQQILRADQALTVTTAAPSTRKAPAALVPRQLPTPVRHFTGREAELQTLTELLDEAVATAGTMVISAIHGTAGIGKTALAVHWAHRAVDRFPDGQLYVNLRGFDATGTVMAPAEAVRWFLDALEVPARRVPTGLDAQAALYRSLLADKHMLVVLDNARDSAQVRPLLPGAPGCLVLVTSRNQLSSLVAAEGAHPLTLDLLSDAEARQLLTRRLGPHRLAAEPDAVEPIIAACARLPLALAIVAARAAAHPRFSLTALAGELRDAHARLDTLAAEEPTTDVRAVFSWSYHQLSPQAARLFRLLGLHPGPDISAPAAASLAGQLPAQVRPLLAELAHAHLIEENQPGRYAFHDLLRVYAAEQTHSIDTDADRQAAVHRTLDHYLHTAYTATGLLNPHRNPVTLTPPRPGVTVEQPADYQQALAWLTAERPVLLAAVGQAADAGFDAHTWRLAATLVDFLDRQGNWRDWAAIQRAALAAAQRLADPAAQALTHRLLGLVYNRLGHLDDAHTQLRQALDLYGQVGDRVGQARTHYALAVMRERLGEYSAALDHARRALDLYEAAGHRNGRARSLNNVGWYHTLLGEYQEALTACQQALPLLQELDDRDGQADTWDSIGYAHYHLGHHIQAITCYQQALRLYRDVGDRYFEATTLTHLGDTHHATDNFQAARDAWQHALTILDDLQHPDAEQLRAKLKELVHR